MSDLLGEGGEANYAERRMAAELLKVEEEARKARIDADAAEIDLSRKQRGWFSGRVVIQSTIGGLVAAGLLAAWGIGYLQPILEKKTELSKIQGEVQQIRGDRLAMESSELKIQQKQLQIEYTELAAELELTSQEKERQAAVLDQSSEEAKRLRSQADEWKKRASLALLRSYTVKVQAEYFEQVPAKRIVDLLSRHGVTSQSIYTRGGGADRVVWTKPHVEAEATSELLKVLGRGWTQETREKAHNIIGDWDILIQPAEDGEESGFENSVRRKG